MSKIIRKRGDTYPDFIIAISDETKTPADVTNCTFTLTVDTKQNPANADTMLFQMVGVVVNGPTGRVKFIPTEEQANQAPKTYYYDIEMVDGAGQILTISKGEYVFEQDITKPIPN